MQTRVKVWKNFKVYAKSPNLFNRVRILALFSFREYCISREVGWFGQNVRRFLAQAFPSSPRECNDLKYEIAQLEVYVPIKE